MRSVPSQDLLISPTNMRGAFTEHLQFMNKTRPKGVSVY